MSATTSSNSAEFLEEGNRVEIERKASSDDFMYKVPIYIDLNLNEEIEVRTGIAQARVDVESAICATPYCAVLQLHWTYGRSSAVKALDGRYQTKT